MAAMLRLRNHEDTIKKAIKKAHADGKANQTKYSVIETTQ
jgi:hypothetical protein